MAERQSRTKGSPSLVVQVVGLVALVATLWTSIQTTMPLVIRPIVEAEMSRIDRGWRQHMDSLNAQTQDTIRVEIRRAVQKATNEMGLMAVEREGKVIYSPRITVQADTMAIRNINLRLDTMVQRWKDLSLVRFERHSPTPASKGDIHKQKAK